MGDLAGNYYDGTWDGFIITGGIDIEIRVASRMFIAPEFHIGCISRISGSIGYLP